jgi:hypothetical protein
MTARALILACVLILCASLLEPQSGSSHAAPVRSLLFTSAPEYQPLAWLHGADRFPRGATVLLRTGQASKPLVPDFFATADASVSFDATSVLFAGKHHAPDAWQIWEIAVPAGTVHQLTHCETDCIRPFYLPGQRFVYARKLEGKFTLESASLTEPESSALQLTRAPGNFLPSDVLADGRILFESGYPLENGKISELYTVYSDGSGVESYRCDHGGSRYAGKQISSGDVVFAQAGKLFRFTSALAHEIPVTTPAGVYAGDVAVTPSGAWLVSWRGTEDGFFTLRQWKPGAVNLQPLVSGLGASTVQPVLLTPRPVPNLHPSALHEWAYANVLCLNAYTSKEPLRESSVATVRLYARDAQGAAHVQGSAKVDDDGSFYLRVPGDRPLRIELLDRSGKAVRAEAGWFWLRSGEQRICVGCHAGPERAPENAVPAVLERSTVAADLTIDNLASSAEGH